VLEEDARKAKPDAAIKRTTSVEEVMLEAGKIGWLEPSDLSGDTHVAKPPMSPIRERKLPDMVSVSNPGSPQLSRTMVHRQNANMYDSNKSLSGSKSDGLPEIGSPRLVSSRLIYIHIFGGISKCLGSHFFLKRKRRGSV
jgi:hypothetical protein